MYISNATGCSSIWGGPAATSPYTVNKDSKKGPAWANSLFEDNAEHGFGMYLGQKTLREQAVEKLNELVASDAATDELRSAADKFIETKNDTKLNAPAAQKLIAELEKLPADNELVRGILAKKDYLAKKSVWIFGGDGWAYDIGFSGIDHVLANHENVNILVLDTEVYSNTGGQSSKSSKVGSIAKFTAKGKEVAKKDLAKIALTYPHVYVGSIAMGANMQHTIKILKEAENYNGPSIVLAYAPCISQGILTGMESTIQEEKKAVETGYYPLFHYNPDTKEFKLDAKADFSRYFEFIAGEDRYRMLKKINPDKYHELLEENRINAIERYNYYVGLEEQSEKQKKEETDK